MATSYEVKSKGWLSLSKSRSSNQKCRVIGSSENQTKNTDSAYDPVTYDIVR